MKKNTRLFLMVAVSSLASQISLDMFQSGFILAMSPLMMMVFLYLFREDLDPFKACCWMTLFSPLVRFVVDLIKTHDLNTTFLHVFPDAGFFFGFALCFAFLTKSLGYIPYHKFYLRLIICDFLGNCTENVMRVMLGLTAFSVRTFETFAIIAFVRCFIVILIAIASDAYMSLLQKQEHEENYKKLILMASTFESEVYSMRKNMNEIEDIMTNAFSLYQSLNEQSQIDAANDEGEASSTNQELRDKALLIAKDIHEVKKGYRRVIQGLQDNFLADFSDDSRLEISDLLKILSVEVDHARDTDGANIAFRSSYESNHIIQKHFAFTSIIRNFISNSIDALQQMPKSHRGEIFVRCRDLSRDGIKYCAIEIKDNGPGISDDELDYIFVPGYSTKFNEETGDINRGVGLTLAKDLLEDQFDGTIDVESGPKGTLFTLWFPVDKLTERVNSYSNYTLSNTIGSEDNVEQYEKAAAATTA